MKQHAQRGLKKNKKLIKFLIRKKINLQTRRKNQIQFQME